MRTGYIPDSRGSIELDATLCPYRSRGAVPSGLVMQPTGTIREQPLLPNCTGEAVASAIEYLTGSIASGVDIWREGLRRSGAVPALDAGLSFGPALAGVESRGWSDRRSGEWEHLPPAVETIEDAVFAADRTGWIVQRSRVIVDDQVCQAVDDALARGFAVVFGARVSLEYMRIQTPWYGHLVVGTSWLGRTGDPHAQRIIGRACDDAGRVTYLVQNSWGKDWGGAVFGGIRHLGCVEVTADCIRHSHAVHVLEAKRVRS